MPRKFKIFIFLLLCFYNEFINFPFIFMFIVIYNFLLWIFLYLNMDLDSTNMFCTSLLFNQYNWYVTV